jgi:ketosteroid isomerase-like protein
MSTAVVHDPIAKEKDEVLAVIAGMKQARHDKNVRAMAASYSADAAIFSLAPPLAHRGIEIAETEEWLDTWEGPIEITPQDFEVRVSGDIAFCHGYMRMDGNKKGVDQRISFWMRETLCLERKEAGWQIVHEHTSVPFYMDGSLRPAFDLKP